MAKKENKKLVAHEKSSHSNRHDSHDEHQAPHEEHEEGEPWLVSYADMMTLLFGFFVVMYSFASKNTNSEEYVKMKLELAFSDKGSVEGMNIVELTEHLVKIMRQNASEEKKNLLSGLGELENANAPKMVDTQQVSKMVESLKILLAGIDKDVFEKDQKQAAIFEDLKQNLNEKLGNFQVKNEGRNPYSAITISLGFSDLLNQESQVSPTGKTVLDRIISHSIKMSPNPQIKVEVFSEASSNPRSDVAKTMAIANVVNQYLLSSGLDPSLLASAAYGSMKPLVDYIDKNGAVDKIASIRNNRIIITIEKRLLEKNNPKM
ncbi:MAG: flagellar motor protein MotB [Pseudomonadota bacterium]